MRHHMVDPDNEERLLTVPPRVVQAIKEEAYAEAVEAIKALSHLQDCGSLCASCDAVAAIQSLGGDRAEPYQSDTEYDGQWERDLYGV